MMNVTEPYVTDEQQRAKALAVRSALPGAVKTARVSEAEARFGLALRGEAIGRRIRRSIRPVLFRERVVRCAQVEIYDRFIPDAGLLAYADAKASGYFSDFCIMWPRYERFSSTEGRNADDPWLIGWLDGSSRGHGIGHEAPRGIVLAYWDDAELHPKRVARA